MSKPNVLDLFSGCGGLSIGLESAGFDVLWANESNPDAAATYRPSHPKTQLYEEDANILLHRMKKSESGLPGPGEVDLVVGGPPCQGFSGYNRHRSVDDPRNSLLQTFLTFVDFLKPPHVLIENVPGILTMESGETVHLLLDSLKTFGYWTRLGILQAGYYGLPQNRWRVFIWGSLQADTLPEFPFPTHEFPRTTVFGATKFRDMVIKAPKVAESMFWKLSPKVDVGQAIGDLPEIPNGARVEKLSRIDSTLSDYQALLRDGELTVWNHVSSRLTGIQLERCKNVPKLPGAGWLDLPEHLKPANLVRHGDKRYDNRFGRLHWTGSFNTILSRAYPYWGAVFHPEQDRVISVRESARAQGFPDSLKFHGGISAMYQQIGNAVPPPLAKAVARQLGILTSD